VTREPGRKVIPECREIPGPVPRVIQARQARLAIREPPEAPEIRAHKEILAQVLPVTPAPLGRRAILGLQAIQEQVRLGTLARQEARVTQGRLATQERRATRGPERPETRVQSVTQALAAQQATRELRAILEQARQAIPA